MNKSLRFEVLRRDGFACTYCGARAPEVQLHIDHVIPVALGGQTVPENLRTSCVDCNTGKGSTPPDAELVAQVADDAGRWAAALAQAAAEAAARSSDDMPWFTSRWDEFTYGGAMRKPIPLPSNWRDSLQRWLSAGLPESVILAMVDVAMGRDHIPPQGKFSYFAGCCWRQLSAMQDRAAAIIAADGGGSA